MKGSLIVRTAFVTLAFVALVFAAPAQAQEFTLDPAHSYIGFTVKHMIIAKVRGEFEDYSASFIVEDGKFASATAEIKVGSINTNITKRDNHLRSEDFFYAAKYPLMTFKTTGVKHSIDGSYTVTGDMTIRGVTKSIELKGEGFGPITDPYGNTRVGFSAIGSLNRFDFGLRWNNLLETGGVIVGDIIQLVIEGEGVLKK
jgi:polyisoprenoid-binding protein YceI